MSPTKEYWLDVIDYHRDCIKKAERELREIKNKKNNKCGSTD